MGSSQVEALGGKAVEERWREPSQEESEKEREGGREGWHCL